MNSKGAVCPRGTCWLWILSEPSLEGKASPRAQMCPTVGLGTARQHKAPSQPLLTGADTCWDAQILSNSLILIPANTLGTLQQQPRCSDSQHTKCLMQIKAIPRKYRWHQ